MNLHLSFIEHGQAQRTFCGELVVAPTTPITQDLQEVNCRDCLRRWFDLKPEEQQSYFRTRPIPFLELGPGSPCSTANPLDLDRIAALEKRVTYLEGRLGMR